MLMLCCSLPRSFQYTPAMRLMISPIVLGLSCFSILAVTTPIACGVSFRSVAAREPDTTTSCTAPAFAAAAFGFASSLPASATTLYGRKQAIRASCKVDFSKDFITRHSFPCGTKGTHTQPSLRTSILIAQRGTTKTYADAKQLQTAAHHNSTNNERKESAARRRTGDRGTPDMR